MQIYALRDLPITPKYGSILLAAALVIGLCGFTGWLTARIARTAVTLLLWAVTAVITSFIISFQPFQIRTLVVWLSNREFWGLNVYPFIDFSILSFIGITVAGFLSFWPSFTGCFQDYRLANLQAEAGDGRWSTTVWKALLLPMPLVFLPPSLPPKSWAMAPGRPSPRPRCHRSKPRI